MLALGTGERLAEINGAQWHNVDLEWNVMRVLGRRSGVNSAHELHAISRSRRS